MNVPVCQAQVCKQSPGIPELSWSSSGNTAALKEWLWCASSCMISLEDEYLMYDQEVMFTDYVEQSFP